MLCEALVALSALTGDPAQLEGARKYQSHLREPMLASPFAFGSLWCAADSLLDGAPALAIVGAPEATRPLLAAVEERYAPTVHVAAARREPPSILAKALAGSRLRTERSPPT